jgi:hypothetical protein
MALRLVNLHKQYEFTPSTDPDKDNPDQASVFQHRPLDSYEQAYLQDRISTIEKMPDMQSGKSPEELMKEMETRTEVHKVAVDCMRIACTGIRNVFDDATGAPVEYDTENVNLAGRTAPRLKMDIVRRIPVGVCMEFYMDVMSKNTVSKSAEKNSGQASSPSNSSTGNAKGVTRPSGGSGDTKENPS